MQTDSPIAIVLSSLAVVMAAGSFFTSWLNYRRLKSPQIVVYLDSLQDSGEVRLVVQNLGGGIAYDISFSDYHGLPIHESFRVLVLQSFLKTGIPMLIPDDRRSTSIHLAQDARDEMTNQTYPITVKYFASRHSHRLTICESYQLDYYSFANSIYSMSNEWKSVQALEKIAKALEAK